MSRVVSFLLVAVTLSGVIAAPVVTFADVDPCASVEADPPAPRIEPDPTIAGSVSNAVTSAPISGATMRLYRCVDGEGTLDDWTTTSTTGLYEFADLAWAYYYVEAAMTGPLNGMTAVTYPNPSDPIAVGDGDTGVDFLFE